MFKGFFGGPSDEDKDAIIAGLKTTVKRLKETVDEYEGEERDFREDFYEREERVEKAHNKEILRIREEADEKVAAEKRGRKLFEEETEAKADKKIEAAEKAADKRVEIAEKAARDAKSEAKNDGVKTEVAVAKAVLEVKTKHVDEVTDLKVDAATATSRAESAEELVESLQGQLDGALDLMAEYAKTNTGFAEKVLASLPKVDLSKFAVNVTVPSPEVTILNAGGNKGNDNGKQQGKQ